MPVNIDFTYLTRRNVSFMLASRILTLASLAIVVSTIFLVGSLATDSQDQEICVIFENEGAPKYIKFPVPSHFITGINPLYSDAACTSVQSSYNAFADGAVYAPDQASAVADCNAGNGSYNFAFREMLAELVDHIWWCDPSAPPPMPIATPTLAPQQSEGISSQQRLSSNWPPPPDLRPTGQQLNEDTDLLVSADQGLGSGIQFQRITAAGVGIQAILDLGFLDGVDVWSHIVGPYTVCFPQLGRIIFLDTAITPRTVSEIEPFALDGYTCATMDRAGTFVLVAAPAHAEQQESSPTLSYSNTHDLISSAFDLQNCSVTPRFHLNLRAAPWGQILNFIPHSTSVPAKARTQSWFNVTYEETEGWSAAWLVNAAGDCDFMP